MQRQKPKEMSSKSQTKAWFVRAIKHINYLVLSERTFAVSVSFEPMILTLFKTIYNPKFCSTPNFRIIKLTQLMLDLKGEDTNL